MLHPRKRGMYTLVTSNMQQCCAVLGPALVLHTHRLFSSSFVPADADCIHG